MNSDRDGLKEFVVVAMESPRYPAEMLAGNALSHKTADQWLDGTTLVIGGGYTKTVTDGQALMQPYGLISTGEWRFPELVIANLVPREENMTIVYDGLGMYQSDLIVAAKDAGFDVVQSDPSALRFGTTGIVVQSGTSVVCFGTGASMNGVHWLRGSTIGGVTCLLTSEQERTPLEYAIMDAVRSRRDIARMLDQFWVSTQADPLLLEQQLAGYGMLATLRGAEWSDLVVNSSRDIETEAVRVVRELAASGYVVYNAGTVRDLAASGYFDSAQEDWLPLPNEWQRLS